jgi:phosphoribosylformylglycinamidine synthase subunit PurQ / glutaminase
MSKFGILVFPGSNCDHDCYHVIKKIFKQNCEYIWHENKSLDGFDCIIIPGGFSYGDYLRTGAIARFSRVMKEVEMFASSGKPVIGICNGFQILVEAGLLPGAFVKNTSTRFICKWVNIRVENNSSPFTRLLEIGQVLRIPIAHAEGNYFATDDGITTLKHNSLIAFRYCDEDGKVSPCSNPNGSIENIAGILNNRGNVLGMMPHPERCAEEILGGVDGARIFKSIISWLKVTKNTKNTRVRHVSLKYS